MNFYYKQYIMVYCEKFNFYKTFSDLERENEYKRIIKKYPDRLPIIIESGTDETLEIKRNKFLVPKDITFVHLLTVVRKNIKLNHEKAIYLMIGETMVPTSTTLLSIYEDYKAKDNFLYVNYYTEKTFG
jgi:hypothetical protein